MCPKMTQYYQAHKRYFFSYQYNAQGESIKLLHSPLIMFVTVVKDSAIRTTCTLKVLPTLLRKKFYSEVVTMSGFEKSKLYAFVWGCGGGRQIT